MTPPPSTPAPLELGRAGFCRGLVHVGDQIAPGFGAFIEACVRQSLEAHGHTYAPLGPRRSPARARKEPL